MLKSLAAALLLTAMATSISANNVREPLPAPGEHEISIVSTWDGTLQPAMLFVPESVTSERQAPLLVALHGKGVDHTAWFRFTPVTSIAEQHGYIVVCPYGRGNMWYRGPGEQDVLDLIDHLIASGRIDPDRVYLIGHSMGGWGTWWIGLRNADRFASIAPMAGFPPMDLMSNALHLDPYIIHDRDDDIVPVELSRKPVARLAELGISHRYVETTGYLHDSKLIGDSLEDVLEWFSTRRRVSDPKRIVLAARTPAKASNCGVHIIATESALETAEVEVETDDYRSYTIRTRNVRQLAIDQSVDDVLIDGQLADDQREPMNPNPRSSQLYFVSHTLLQKSEGAWFMTRGWYTDFKNPPVIPPPAISTESVSLDLESQLADHPPEDVARTLGAIVAKASGAEGMIVRADAFAWLGSPLTPDRLADSYVSASETLGFHSLTGNQITEILAADPGLVLAGLDNLQLAPARAYSIISPISPLVRHDALKNPTSATGPVYKYLLRGMDITTWE